MLSTVLLEYNWLDYNKVNENVTCFICKKRLQKLDQEKNEEGFCNWKKAFTSFRCHQQSKCHLAALTFQVTVPQCLQVLRNFHVATKIFKIQ